MQLVSMAKLMWISQVILSLNQLVVMIILVLWMKLWVGMTLMQKSLVQICYQMRKVGLALADAKWTLLLTQSLSPAKRKLSSNLGSGSKRVRSSTNDNYALINDVAPSAIKKDVLNAAQGLCAEMPEEKQ